jgi:aerobic-type carbon monoxide dehydrogenase small subunit (CoxS/CutS family)
MRIEDHPILGPLEPGQPITLWVDGVPVPANDGEPIAAALVAAGYHVFRRTTRQGRPRGLFCAVGRCTDCVMIVDGQPNVRTCVTPAADGMVIETQVGVGRWAAPAGEPQ